MSIGYSVAMFVDQQDGQCALTHVMTYKNSYRLATWLQTICTCVRLKFYSLLTEIIFKKINNIVIAFNTHFISVFFLNKQLMY